MTYTAVNKQPIDVKMFYDQNVSTLKNNLFIENKSFKFNKKGHLMKSFGNQVTIKHIDRKINIKLFYNNKVQITGIRSEQDAHMIIDELNNSYNLKIEDSKLVMQNMVTKLSTNMLNLYSLYDQLLSKNYDTHYTPEIYPGLKLKVDNSTALLFATGSLIISSGNPVNDVPKIFIVLQAIIPSLQEMQLDF